MTPLPLADAHLAPGARQPSSTILRWAAVVSAWGLIAAVDITQMRFHFVMNEPHHGWAQATVRAFPLWGLWMLLTPLVWILAQRFPLDRRGGARNLALHLVAALLLTVLHFAAVAVIAVRIGWPAEYGIDTAAMFSRYIGNKIHLDLLAYAAVAGAVHALDYQRRLHDRELAASQMQARLVEAQLHALQSQIHPHFLFNTLNAISVLALKGQTQCVVRMLARLSDLLRVTLESSAAQEVTLREELELLRMYLELEQVRFGDRLDVRMEVDPRTLDSLVPNLLMQPLVENAVRHGVAETVGTTRIAVSAARVGEELRLEVSDNGPGFPRHGTPAREGIGLSNTRARLARLYDGRARLELAEAEGGGARVRVDLPFRPRPASRSAAEHRPQPAEVP